MRLEACVPCYNCAATVGRTIQSLKEQTIGVEGVFLVDDGSTDATAEEAARNGARVISLGSNQGRGAARARCFEETAADLLLSADGTGALATDFVATSMPWFEDSGVAVVYGRISQLSGKTATDRWRGRHLYKVDEVHSSGPSDTLITWAFISRPSAIREVGNFDRSLRHSEDREMGERLLAAGWKIIYEPKAVVTTLTSNSLGQVLERYWRWNAGTHPRFSGRAYLRSILYSFKVLARRDVAARDFASVVISLMSPHYCAYRTAREGRGRRKA